MGISITIDSKYVELKNRLIGHKSISFKEQYKVVWRLYNGLICKIDYIAFKKIKYWKIMLSILIGLLASLWCIYLNLGNFITLIISAFLFFLTYTVAMCIMKEKLVLEILSQILKKIHIL